MSDLKNSIIEKYKQKEAYYTDQFYQESKQRLYSLFRDGNISADINGKGINRKEAEFCFRDLIFKATHQVSNHQRGIQFSVQLKCKNCNAEFYSTPFQSLEDLGRVFDEELYCFQCNRVINIDFTPLKKAIEYFQQNIKKYGCNVTKNNQFVLLTDFINGYNEWASNQNYPLLDNLSQLGDLQSILLKKEIKSKSIWVLNQTTGISTTKRGVMFFLDEMIPLLMS